MTENLKVIQENMVANSHEAPTPQEPKRVATKLIIENKEFQIIKYSCETNDRWYIGELGLMIEKKIMTRDDGNIKKGDIIWEGYGSGKEKEQLKKLIYFGESEIEHWKKKIKELKEAPHNFTKDKETFQKLGQYEKRLQKAINGLEELKKLSESKGTEISQEPEKTDQKPLTIQGTLTSPIQLRGENTKEPYHYSFIRLKGQSIDLPVVFKTNGKEITLKKSDEVKLTGNYSNSEKNVRKSFTAHTYQLLSEKRIRKKCIGCCDTFTCYQSQNYDYCKNCELNGSRYVPRQNKCPECGDGSGIIKFSNQPPRNCKTCYLTGKSILNQAKTQLPKLEAEVEKIRQTRQQLETHD